MQTTEETTQEVFDLRTAKMPRGYADYIAAELKVPTKRVYKVRYGEQEDKQVELALLSIAIKYREEQELLTEAIASMKQRANTKREANQLSLFY